jgi:hypothetical protein
VKFRAFGAAFAALWLIATSGVARGESAPTRRIAIVVGANDSAPGQKSLRYARTDAEQMGGVLTRVGRFANTDVHVLLDPTADELRAQFTAVAAQFEHAGPDSFFLFYYSGHSDGQQVFPHGQGLPLVELRDRIAASSARVRVAILDTCRGGGWTRAKGLSVGPPLDAVELASVAPEGTALLASSSGVESAHEAGAIKGSFFTHHVAAGLLGAADKSGDGNVTLQEVFDYAKERTVRDTARMALAPQHPSFDMQLRGRQDLVLAQVASSPSALQVSQTNSLEVIHVSTGVTVLETPPGPAQLRLALVPGHYVVRRVVDGKVYSKDVDVAPGATVVLNEAQLELTGSEKLALKDAVPREEAYSAHSTVPRRILETRLALGVTTGRGVGGINLTDSGRNPYSTGLTRAIALDASFTYGITNRLSWSAPVPAFAYRIGNEGSFEFIPRLGITAIGFSSIEGLITSLDVGFATRTWLSGQTSLVSNAAVRPQLSELRSSIGGMASFGLVHRVFEGRLSMSAGVGWMGMTNLDSPTVPTVPLRVPTQSEVMFGAVQQLGYRSLPLVQVQLSRSFSLDAYGSWFVDLRSGAVRDRYLAGFTYSF